MRSSFLLLVLGLAVAISGCHRKPEPLPVLGSVSPFALTDQTGQAVRSSELQGEVWVAAFFFTRCPTVCPRLMAFLRRARDAAKAKGTSLRVVAITVDPDHDTPARLTAYARDRSLDGFTLLTGASHEAIQRLAEGTFKIAAEGTADATKDHFGIAHGAHVVLVDPSLRIRGFYGSGDPANAARLARDAGSL